MKMDRMLGLALCAGIVGAGIAAAADDQQPANPHPSAPPAPAAAPKSPAAGPHGQPVAAQRVHAIPPQPPSKEPGTEHKVLSGFVGKWSSMTKLASGAPQPENVIPKDTEMKGTAEGKLEMDGRFAEFKRKCVLRGKPYEAEILFGFDDVIRRYTAIWFDTTSPAFVSYVGTYDVAKKTFNLSARFSDQGTHRLVVSRIELKFVDADTIELNEFEGATVGGPDTQSLTTTFKRG